MSPAPPFCRIPAHWILDPSQCWYDWQTLIGGLLAVSAAAVSVYFLKKQISQTDLLHQAELARQHNAVRTVTPIALSAITAFCHAISDEVCSEIERRPTQPLILDAAGDEIKQFAPHRIPDSALPTMQGLVATLTEKSKIKHVAELVGSLQILQSRYNGFDMKISNVEDALYEMLIYCAKVKLLTDSMFNYSRLVDEENFSLFGSDRSENEIWDDIYQKFQSLIFDRKDPLIFFKIKEKIDSYKDQDISPWMEKFGQ